MGLPDPADGTSLYWKIVSRNKRCATLDLKSDDGRGRLLRLVERRPRAHRELPARHARAARPRPRRAPRPQPAARHHAGHRLRPGRPLRRVGPGFATIAEAMSGFAALNGEPDGGPLLPPIALTDEVTALAAAFATMTALWSGVGQVVDVNLLESLFQCMGPLPGAYASSGYLQPRLGSGIPYSVPRGTWRCADDHWVAVSTSAESVAARVMELIGFGDRADLATFNGRIAARDEIDARMAEWCGARTLARSCSRSSRPPTPRPLPCTTWPTSPPTRTTPARGSIVDVDGVPMQGLIARLSATPGQIRWPGRALGADDPPAWAP